jgi:hypothetical protein
VQDRETNVPDRERGVQGKKGEGRARQEGIGACKATAGKGACRGMEEKGHSRRK